MLSLWGLMGRRFLMSLHVWGLLSPLALFQHCRGAGSGAGLWLRGLGAAGKEAKDFLPPGARKTEGNQPGQGSLQETLSRWFLAPGDPAPCHQPAPQPLAGSVSICSVLGLQVGKLGSPPPQRL